MDMLSRCAPGPRAALCGVLLAGPLLAQAGTGSVRGRVTDRSSGAPLANVAILLIADGRSVRSDSAGDYLIDGLPPGSSQLLFRALGFPPTNVLIELRGHEALVRPVALDSTTLSASTPVLPTVPVVAEAPPESFRLVDFERRRRTGRGQYLTEEQIVRSGAYNVQEALRSMRGIKFECASAHSNACRVQMARAPRNCPPDYVVDARVENMFGPTTPIRDVVGIEVYTGASDVTGEFAGANSGCGVIVIWTRSGPTRRQ
jgi:hypothetical protein